MDPDYRMRRQVLPSPQHLCFRNKTIPVSLIELHTTVYHPYAGKYILQISLIDLQPEGCTESISDESWQSGAARVKKTNQLKSYVGLGYQRSFLPADRLIFP